MSTPAPCPTCPHLEDEHSATGCRLCDCRRDPIRAASQRRQALHRIIRANPRRHTP